MGHQRLKVAFYLASSMKNGGGFQYEYKAVRLLLEHGIEGVELHLVSEDTRVVDEYQDKGIEVSRIMQDNKKDGLEDSLRSIDVDLIYFLSPSGKARELVDIPYIITVWDLCHRDQNEFPEVRCDGVFERREEFYMTVLKKAVRIMTDSELGKENLCRRYGIDSQRVEVLKFLPREDEANDTYIDITKQYDLSRPYLFYPAQFWAHKNHIYILKALSLLKYDHGIEIDALFSGSDQGNLDHILKKAKELGVDEQVRYIGFVDDAEIPYLYKQSLALVMPTYFGPTNIPPLEAFKYETPVCYSDLEGLREQVGDAAFLMDLKDPKSLVWHLVSILDDDAIVAKKVQAGSAILKGWTDADFLAVISGAIQDYAVIRECWGNDVLGTKNTGLKLSSYAQRLEIAVEFLDRHQDRLGKCVIYGHGVMGKLLYALIPEEIIGFIDKDADKERRVDIRHPSMLTHMEYDHVIISVLGREEQLVAYLQDELHVDNKKILRLDD